MDDAELVDLIIADLPWLFDTICELRLDRFVHIGFDFFVIQMEDASRAQWSSPQDIKRRYASASSVASNRVAFNIKGNEFRLVVAVAYQFRAVYIKFVGTHAQYDAIDAATVEPRP